MQNMDKLWQILIVASLVLMTVNHPILMVVVAGAVFIYHKNPKNIKYKIVALWKKMTTKRTPPPPPRRPRMDRFNQ